MDSIRDILGSNAPEDSQDVSDGNIGLVYLKGPLNETQTRQLEVSLIEKHLYFTKQIILLMDLKASDLGVLDQSIEAQKIRYQEVLDITKINKISRQNRQSLFTCIILFKGTTFMVISREIPERLATISMPSMPSTLQSDKGCQTWLTKDA